MTVYYFDTSALVKRYAHEVGSSWVTNLTDPKATEDIYTSRLTGPEMISAFFLKTRTGHISTADAIKLANSFKQDWQTQYQLIEVSNNIANQAMLLIEKHPLRGYDAVHLATALTLQLLRQTMGLTTLTFISADLEQLRAAQAEGLLVENPNNYP